MSVALFVSRHGKHRQHVRQNVLDSRGSRTQWARVGREAADLRSGLPLLTRAIPLHTEVNGPVILTACGLAGALWRNGTEDRVAGRRSACGRTPGLTSGKGWERAKVPSLRTWERAKGIDPS